MALILVALLAGGKKIVQAAKTAAVAAGISVTRHGAAGSIPTKAEIDAAMKEEKI
jgi:sugar/nucleoside kinase (ribokinase family)